MQIIEITEKDRSKYDHFVENHPLGSIHQTWEWAVFQTKTAGRDKFWVLALEEKGEIKATAVVIRQQLPFKKSWLYSSRGPLIDYSNPTHDAQLWAAIADLAKKENAVFFRFDPAIQKVPSHFKKFGARTAHAHYQPEHTLLLNLKQSPEELLKQMKPKGRYNIKVAQKHGVEVRRSDGNSLDLQAFYNLLQQTTSRDEFSGHSLSYYQNMLSILGPDKSKLYLAQYQGKTVAGMIATFFKDTAIYYFGASSNEHRNTMAPYLLQWQAIEDARKAGFHFYDFLGIAPENQSRHPWAGVTDFKLKFGGERVNYIPAQEIVYKPLWYQLIKFVKRLRKS